MGAYIIGNRFNAFKQEMISLRETLERHFNTIMLSIQNGLPEVEESEVDQIDYMFKLGENQPWTCRTCQVYNQATNQLCTTCKSKKPEFKIEAPKPKKVEKVVITSQKVEKVLITSQKVQKVDKAYQQTWLAKTAKGPKPPKMTN